MHIPTTQDVIDLQVLEALADAKAAGERRASLGTLEQHFENRDALMEWVVRAEANGWIRDDGRTTHSKAITSAGEEVVETARTRRNDPGLRRQTARTRLLHWVDGNVTSTSDLSLNSGNFFGSGHAWFEGAILTVDDLSDAIKYLVGKGLLHGTGKSWGHTLSWIGITHEGQECVTDFDSDVRAFLDRSTGTPAVSNIQHFHGDFRGQNAQGQNISQSQHNGIDAAQLETVFKAMREALSDIEDDDRETLELAISDLESATRTDEPDPEQVAKRMNVVRRLVTTFSTSAASSAGTNAGARIIDNLGELARAIPGVS